MVVAMVGMVRAVRMAGRVWVDLWPLCEVTWMVNAMVGMVRAVRMAGRGGCQFHSRMQKIAAL